ncbi:MAG: D-inositol-3-phosphate glycosyltransferase [Myxococcota bacterium]|nr:D-inositol-3-phosphate glycosyltransferase [Myxococcota bacterium]
MERPEAMTAAAHVVHIITMLELGGAQQNTLYTCEHLDRGRFSVGLAYGPGGILNPDAGRIPALERREIPDLLREINPIRDFRAFVALRDWLRAEKARTRLPLVAHTHSSKAGVLGRAAAKAAGADVIIHSIHGFGFHDFMPPARKAFYIGLERAAAPVTDFFIAVSRENADTAVRLGLCAPDRVRVIHSGIPIREFQLDEAARKSERSRIRAELGLSEKTPVAGFIGNMKPQKCPTDFVKVARIVRRKLPDAHFFIAGDGPLRPEVEKLIAEYGLQDCFHLLGWRRDVPGLFAAMDVFCLTSLWEGLPRVFPQAMAAGAPVVGTAVNGGPEAIIHGENGYLCKPGDVEGLASHLYELLNQKPKRQLMGERGRARVREWDIDQMVRDQEELYLQLLREKGLC